MLALGAALIWGAVLPVRAGEAVTLDALGLSDWGACAGAFEQALPAGARCFADQALNGMFDGALQRLGGRGQALFGQYFRVENRMRYSSANGGGLRGDLDFVVPLSFSASSVGEGHVRRALFLQEGLSRWEDRDGFRRNDVRHGMVYRHALSTEPGSGVAGASAFYQHNLERGHERFVAGMDYVGRWGVGTFHYYLPVTGWLPGRAGYEERAREGMELGLRLEMTDTLSLDLAAGRWEDDDGSGVWSAQERLGLKWQPHTWLDVAAGWDSDAASASLGLALRVPLHGGGRASSSRWRGLGLAGGGSATAPDIWRTDESVGRIRYAERIVQAARPRHGVREAQVRFLQDRAVNGAEIRLEVTLPSPASEDIRLRVQLVPGGGAHPAVAGRDYVDEPVAVTVPRGGDRAVVSMRLPKNPKMRRSRALSAVLLPFPGEGKGT